MSGVQPPLLSLVQMQQLTVGITWVLSLYGFITNTYIIVSVTPLTMHKVLQRWGRKEINTHRENKRPQEKVEKASKLVKILSDLTTCDQGVDIGSGQGHLSCFLSFGQGLAVTAMETDESLVTMARTFDQQLMNINNQYRWLVQCHNACVRMMAVW